MLCSRSGSGVARTASAPQEPTRHLRPQVERLEARSLLSVAAPTGVTAAGVSASAIALHWNKVPDATVTGYDVLAKVWVVPPHGGKGSPTGGHYVYNLMASNLAANADTVTGLATGSFHTYVVTAVSPTGQSAYSTPATAETWVAPSFRNGSSTFLLSSGALWSGPLAATVGLTTQLSLLVSGNPLNFARSSGPSNVSIDPTSGVVTFTPTAAQIGSVSATFTVSNALGSISQTIQFTVAAANPLLAKPTLKLYSTASTYTGQIQQVSAMAVGTDGVTPVAGTFAIAYNGGAGGAPIDVGTYPVLVTFTSLDPRYANATLLTHFTISKATPAFSALNSSTIAIGTASTVLSGRVAAGSAVPTGDPVRVNLNGIAQYATVDTYGNFTTTFPTASLARGAYTVSYAFPGDNNFNPATGAVSQLTVIATAAPLVTLNPRNVTTTAGDPVTLTAAATGSPVPTVQWQVSTDGGLTFTNIYSPSGTTLTFASSLAQNGYRYRAVFTNSVGVAITTVAILTVQTDSGGGGD